MKPFGVQNGANRPMPQSFQFSVASLLWALTWSAIGFGAFAFGVQLVDESSPVADYPDWIRIVAGILCLITIAVSPGAAIGALLGNIRRGVQIGGMIALFLFVLALLLPAVRVE